MLPPAAPPVPPDEHARDLIAAARAAKQQMLDAIERYEQAVWAAAWDRGHQQGIADGENYAFWKIERARSQMPLETEAPPRTEPPAPPTLSEEEDVGPSAQEVVRNIVMSRAGLRGVEIVAEAESRGTPVKERTVRTALHRLKNAGEIVNIDERWYPPGFTTGVE